MTFGTQHPALLAEYRSLMDEEATLWRVIAAQLDAFGSSASTELPDAADLERWPQVRDRRARLDAAMAALTAPRTSQWGELADIAD